MADVAIVNRATVTAPKDYTLASNEELVLKAVRALVDGTGAGGSFIPVLQLVAPDGTVMWQGFPGVTVAAGGSVDVSWFPAVTSEEEAATVAGVTTEQLFLDSPTGSVTASTVLVSGQPYIIVVQGTYSIWNEAIDVGTPNADAMFPGSTAGRVSTQVGLDAESIFAHPHDATVTIGHTSVFRIDLGAGFVHLEPQGGPYATPQPNYLYRYSVTGAGAAPSFQINDAPLIDNYGKLQITIQGTSGQSSGGGGGGSLVPPGGTDYAALQVLAGVPVWSAAIDGGSA